jgi:hypothetical protein
LYHVGTLLQTALTPHETIHDTRLILLGVTLEHHAIVYNKTRVLRFLNLFIAALCPVPLSKVSNSFRQPLYLCRQPGISPSFAADNEKRSLEPLTCGGFLTLRLWQPLRLCFSAEQGAFVMVRLIYRMITGPPSSAISSFAHAKFAQHCLDLVALPKILSGASPASMRIDIQTRDFEARCGTEHPP